jgi:hypothetical protein
VVASPTMHGSTWLVGLGLALIAAVIARGFWLYRASLTWPTADGVITRIDIERVAAARRAGTIFLPRLRMTSAIRVGTAFLALGIKIFQPKLKLGPSQIANYPSTRRLS